MTSPTRHLDTSSSDLSQGLLRGPQHRGYVIYTDTLARDDRTRGGNAYRIIVPAEFRQGALQRAREAGRECRWDCICGLCSVEIVSWRGRHCDIRSDVKAAIFSFTTDLSWLYAAPLHGKSSHNHVPRHQPSYIYTPIYNVPHSHTDSLKIHTEVRDDRSRGGNKHRVGVI